MTQTASDFVQAIKEHNFMGSILALLIIVVCVVAVKILLPFSIANTIMWAIAGWQLGSWACPIARKFKNIFNR